jgi:hypothetical protein
VNAEILNCQVKCDEPDCQWAVAVDLETIGDYHRQPCPDCGNGEIISDQELVFAKMMLAGVKIVNQIDLGVTEESPRVTASFDTATMRTGCAGQ